MPASADRSAGAWTALCSRFFPVEAKGLHHRRVAEAEEEGRAVAVVDVLAEIPGRHREDVLVVPSELLAADHGTAAALDDVEVLAADMAMRLGLLAGA